MPLEVDALMQNPDNNGPALGGPKEQNVRADQELSRASRMSSQARPLRGSSARVSAAR
jgi:hypothetical protein